MMISDIEAWFVKKASVISQGVAIVFTTLFYMVCFPPFDVSEAAFVLFIPLLIWFRFKPSYRSVALTSLGIGWVVWIVLIFWLRHVSWLGMLLLSGVVAVHFSSWALGAAWLTRRIGSIGGKWGVVYGLGLASWWVALEWVRTWIFSGFPWLPLSASQWSQPIVLQGAPLTGAWGISFALVFLNVGVTGYLIKIAQFARSRKKTFCIEFYVSLSFFVYLTFMQAKEVGGQEREPYVKIGAMQPAIPQNAKWDPGFSVEILQRLEANTLMVGASKPELILWPEAILPYPVVGDDTMRTYVERLATNVGVPVVLGALAREDREGEDIWRNSVYLVRPNWGMHPLYYSKQHMVPFGEYIPLRQFWPWLKKIVPLEGDFARGEKPVVLPVELEDKSIRIAPLLCYEDIFPDVARKFMTEGVGLFFVATNSAWYGKEWMPRQHMVHSVLRAVETRRVVVRCGNDGWSGWIDEYGNVRNELTDEDGSVFFRGGASWEIDRDVRWKGQQTLYVRWGDWFVWLSLLMCGICGYAAFRKSPL